MPTMRQKIEKYEMLLHQIQLNAQVVMDHERVRELIDQICSWSYAHRVGNGELTHRQQNRIIQKAFDKLGT